MDQFSTLQKTTAALIKSWEQYFKRNVNPVEGVLWEQQQAQPACPVRNMG